MKKLFTILAVAAAVVACQKNETIALDNGEAISFGNAFVENSVRAAVDPSYSANDIASFKVYGTVDASNGNPVVIYPGATVTKTADYGAAWSCTDAEGNEIKQYWVPGATYKFVGIVDGDKENVSKTTLVNGMPTTISYTADGVTDLLCQTIDKVANTNGTNGLVAFNFNHLLAKVNFTVNNNSTEADKYSFVVKNIAFAGNTEGVYNVATAAWDTTKFKTGSTAVGNGTDKTIIVATKAASSELNTEVLFLPGTYSVSFTVDILYDGTVITTTNYPVSGSYSHTLEAGKAYNFIAEVAVGELIQFTVKEQPKWDTPTNDVEL